MVWRLWGNGLIRRRHLIQPSEGAHPDLGIPALFGHAMKDGANFIKRVSDMLRMTKITSARMMMAMCALLINAALPLHASPDHSEVRYFPTGAISSNPTMDRDIGFTLGLELRPMQEKPLYKIRTNCDKCTRVRLLWDRGIGPPIVVDVALFADGTGVITTKTIEYREDPIYNMKEIYNPATDKVVRKLSAFEVSRLQNMLGSVDFSKPLVPDKEARLDGEMYFLERMKGHRYGLLWHDKVLVHFWHWNESRFMEACKYVVRLSDARKLDAALGRN